MIEDSTLVPEPDTAMDPRARLFIISVAVLFNAAFFGGLALHQFSWEYKREAYAQIHGVIGALSFLGLLCATFVCMVKACPERKLCYRCWFYTLCASIAAGFFLSGIS